MHGKFNVALTNGTLEVNNKEPFSKREVLLYPLPLIVVLGLALLLFGSSLLQAALVALGFSFFIGLLFALYKFFSSMHYTAFIIQQDGLVVLSSMKNNKVKRTKILDTSFELKKLVFKKVVSSGKTKYLMSYKSAVDEPIWVINSEEEKERIQHFIQSAINKQHAN
jgi:hypothetical protein